MEKGKLERDSDEFDDDKIIDIYDDDVAEIMLDNDEIDAREEAFIQGYIGDL